ncbi:MAG: ABC transporter ATP-binding protein [Synergistaceae bacterium]|jgi:oligopeptide/dipeptide ABC transporter ATP-binding protein|nr:ABC transporter ATP-binding protein [Synergistaceae bacterium]
MPDSELLRVANLNVVFNTSEGTVHALQDVNFSLKRGEILGLVGETGSGKSMTSMAIMRLIPSPPGRIARGTITFEGRNLLSLTEEEMRRVRGRDISMIFQDPASYLNPVMTVGAQVEESIRSHSRLTPGEIRRRTVEMFEKVNIPDAAKSVKRFPHQFSGGMKQRVMIAMALACSPKLLIADEPTTALDVSIQAQILSLIKKLQQDMGSSILLISHDLGIIATMARSVAVMYAGNIVEYGSAESIFEHPGHPYTQGLLNAIPRLDQDQELLTVIPGTLPNPLTLPEGCSFSPRCELARKICRQKAPPSLEIEPGHRVICHEYGK